MNHKAKLNDLNLGLIREFLQEIGSQLYEESASMPFEDLCRQMAIAKPGLFTKKFIYDQGKVKNNA